MILKRFVLGGGGILLSCGIALAQPWGVGASVGLTNDVDHRFALDEFRRHDVNAWVQYEIEERVMLRGSFGSLRVSGSKAGTTGNIVGSPTAPLPDLTDRINYGTLGGPSREFSRRARDRLRLARRPGRVRSTDPTPLGARAVNPPQDQVGRGAFDPDGECRAAVSVLVAHSSQLTAVS